MPARQATELTGSARVAWLLFIIAAWMLVHQYQGLRHDAVMYSMQGLAHVHPEYWRHDVYLRFGSQDKFSAFAPLFARFIGWFGLEPAAALLTGIAQLAFFVAAWRLARLLLPERDALMGLFLLVALPGSYGSNDIFHLAENFITPRLLAEALVLAAILQWFKGRRVLAGGFVVAGLIVHPIMAASALALYLWLVLVQPRPRIALLLLAIALAALALVGLMTNGPPLRFDDFWYQVSPSSLAYLLIGHWDSPSWSMALVPLLVLMAGGALLDRQPARRLAQAGLGIGLAGIALTAFGGDLLHLTLIVQGQPWRCLWLSAVLAILLLPWIVRELWQRDDLGKAMVLVLLAEFILVSERYSVWLAPCCALLLALSVRARDRVPERQQRLALYGAMVLLAVAVTVMSSELLTTLRSAYFPHAHGSAPLWAKRVSEIMHNGLAALLVLLVFTWATRPRAARWSTPLVALLCAVGCCALIPLSCEDWTQVAFPPADKQMFASWRARIPADAEVLFPESPLFTWVLLERPSYLSGAQATSGLFSRPAAMFLYGRTEALRPYLRAIGQSIWDLDPKAPAPATPTLAMACAVGDLQFVVSRETLAAIPLEEVPPGAKSIYRGLKLYQCPGYSN
jgi:hypothetical protein